MRVMDKKNGELVSAILDNAKQKEKAQGLSKKEFCLVKFHRNTGRICTSLEAEGFVKLLDWAIRNTPKTKDTIIFSKENGDVVYCLEGTENGGPTLIQNNLGNIEDYCTGLLEAVQSD